MYGSLLQDLTRQEVEDYVQDERYIAGEHMDVRRDCVSFARDQFLVSPSPRGSRAQYPWHCANLKEAAPAHPCARGIPFILNITARPEASYRAALAPGKHPKHGQDIYL